MQGVLHVHHVLPAAAGLVVVPEQLLMPTQGLWGLNRHQAVAALRVLAHQDPALVQLLAPAVLLQLVLTISFIVQRSFFRLIDQLPSLYLTGSQEKLLSIHFIINHEVNI